LVLSDITVCKTGNALDPNDTVTYPDPTDPMKFPNPADRPEWLSGLTAQVGPTPKSLCEIAPGGNAMNDDGTAPPAASYVAGDVPSLAMAVVQRHTEGQTVLTNGVNVGGRLGTPAAPRALVGGAPPPPAPKNIQSGQGL